MKDPRFILDCDRIISDRLNLPIGANLFDFRLALTLAFWHIKNSEDEFEDDYVKERLRETRGRGLHN